MLPPLLSRPRWGLLLGVALVVGVIAYLAFSSIGNALVYYLTPTELVRGARGLGYTSASAAWSSREPHARGDRPDLRPDRRHDRDPRTQRRMPTRCSFREGVGAVVEGR